MKFAPAISLLLMQFSAALAQPDSKVELGIAVGSQIPGFQTFKNDHTLSLSGCYSVADRWRIGGYIEERKYSLNQPIGEHQAFVGGSKPDIQKNVVSFLLTGTVYPVGEKHSINPYLSFGVGYSSSTSSSESFYYYNTLVPQDTLMFRITSGSFVLGLAGLGVDCRVTSFIDVFAEIQVPFLSNQDPYPFAISGRIGLGFEL